MPELSEFGKLRLQKAEELRRRGIDPFAYRFERSHQSGQVAEEFASLAVGEHSQKEVRAAGRLLTLRGHGKTSFAHLGDPQGKLQVYFRLDILGEEVFNNLFK